MKKITRGRRVQTSVLKLAYDRLGINKGFYGTLVTTVPDLATQTLVRRKFDVIVWFDRGWPWASMEVKNERSADLW